MKLSEAQAIAERVRDELLPFTERAEIGGSVRRKRSDVNDIELITIPKTIPGGLFKDMAERDPGFVKTVGQWFAIKGNVWTGKYTQVVLPDGINLDLFIATPDNFGVIFAIRTGSADYSHQVLARGWSRLGYESKGGVLWKDGRPTYIREESALFALLGIPWLEPEKREI